MYNKVCEESNVQFFTISPSKHYFICVYEKTHTE